MIRIPHRVTMTVEYEEEGLVLTHELSGITRMEITVEREMVRTIGGPMFPAGGDFGRIMIEGYIVAQRVEAEVEKPPMKCISSTKS